MCSLHLPVEASQDEHFLMMDFVVGCQYCYINGHRIECPQVSMLLNKTSSLLCQGTTRKHYAQIHPAWLLQLECPASLYTTDQTDNRSREAHFNEGTVLAEVEEYIAVTLASTVIGDHRPEGRSKQSMQAPSPSVSDEERGLCQLTGCRQVSSASQAASFASQLSKSATSQHKPPATKIPGKSEALQREVASGSKRSGVKLPQKPLKSLQTIKHNKVALQGSYQHASRSAKDPSQPPGDKALSSAVSNCPKKISVSIADLEWGDPQPFAHAEAEANCEAANTPTRNARLTSERQMAIPLADILQDWKNPCTPFSQPVHLAASAFRVISHSQASSMHCLRYATTYSCLRDLPRSM